MAALIASVCCTLVILAICQVIIETVLPDGSTKRYVEFITGLVAVLVIVTTFTLSGQDALKMIYSKTEEIKGITDRQGNIQAADQQTNPYTEYIKKLIDSYR